jgi:hypothetical protein
MPVERREQVIAMWLGSVGDGKNPMFNGGRLRECHVRLCERLGAKISRAHSESVPATCHENSLPYPKTDQVTYPTRHAPG